GRYTIEARVRQLQFRALMLEIKLALAYAKRFMRPHVHIVTVTYKGVGRGSKKSRTNGANSSIHSKKRSRSAAPRDKAASDDLGTRVHGEILFLTPAVSRGSRRLLPDGRILPRARPSGRFGDRRLAGPHLWAAHPANAKGQAPPPACDAGSF